ncbi:uncharacterized protein LOC118197043 [Stegodyphus dumicola]|uniref:uncharacterized protein LOC118197043 n=1 Tax=Stegodyphus dumicola TaxID=202533 RepID=UPI0015A80760|nr:uncharacterized protein LOC118197043 [Stegodyphus dumicola]
MSGLQQVLEELCDGTSTLRKNYAKHAPCYSKISETLQNCTAIAEEKVAVLLKNNVNLHLLNVHYYRCLAHIELVGCLRDIAGTHCGESAGRLIAQLVERSVRPFRYLKCGLLENADKPDIPDDLDKEKKIFF